MKTWWESHWVLSSPHQSYLAGSPSPRSGLGEGHFQGETSRLDFGESENQRSPDCTSFHRCLPQPFGHLPGLLPCGPAGLLQREPGPWLFGECPSGRVEGLVEIKFCLAGPSPSPCIPEARRPLTSPSPTRSPRVWRSQSRPKDKPLLGEKLRAHSGRASSAGELRRRPTEGSQRVPPARSSPAAPTPGAQQPGQRLGPCRGLSPPPPRKSRKPSARGGRSGKGDLSAQASHPLRRRARGASGGRGVPAPPRRRLGPSPTSALLFRTPRPSRRGGAGQGLPPPLAKPPAGVRRF